MEIEAALERDPSLLKRLAAFAEKAHSPARALQMLGLSHHPSAALIKGYRDPIHSKIVYHADPGTLYRVAADWRDLAPPRPPVRPMLQDQANDRSGAAGEAGLQGSTEHNFSSSVEQMKDAPAASSVAPQHSTADELLVPGSDEQVPAFDAALNDIFKSHLLRSFAVLAEHRAETAADDVSRPVQGQVLSARFNPCDIEALVILCEDLPGPSAEQEKLEIGKEIHAASASGWTFFQLIRSGVGDVVTPLKSKRLFKRTDWAIMLLRVLRIDKSSKTVVLAPFEKVANVVLSLDVLPLDTLLRLHTWKFQADLHYAMPAITLAVSDSANKHLPSFLGHLLCDGGFMLEGSDANFTERRALLEEMHEKDLVQLHEGEWSLTQRGKDAVEVGQVVSHAAFLVKPREIPVEDMEVVELMLCLHRQGWKHESVSPKGWPVREYVHDTSSKVWFLDSSKDSVNREYLLLLLTAEDHKKPVPHFAAASVYSSMLGKEVKQQKRRASQALVFFDDEDVWVDQSALQAPPRKRKTPQAGIRSQEAVLDDFPEARTVEDVVLQDAESDEQPGQVGQAQNSQGSASAGNQPADVAATASADSSSSSSSSSSSVPSDSNDSSTSSSDAPSDPVPARRERVARRQRDVQASHAWGLCRLTATRTGWQMTCAHPSHRPPGATAACTKTRSSGIDGEQAALRLLKAWAVYGRDAESKAQHQGEIWKRVTREWRQGALPTTEQLDARAVQDYPE